MSRTTDFDKEDIIDKAMKTFWNKGYTGTTIKDLTEATGLMKGSLYNTFKSKENLFLLCLEKYGNYSNTVFNIKGDPKKFLKQFFERLIEEGIDKENVKGCLIMNSCLELTDSESKPAKKSQELFKQIELNFEKVIKAITKGSAKDAQKHKTTLVTAAFAIREISKFKKDKKFLKEIANNALSSLDISI